MKVIHEILLLVAIVGTTGGQIETLKVTTILTAPFLMKNEDGYQGYCYDLAKEISGKLGMNMSLQLVKDGKYGTLNSDGEWEGMIGEVIRGEADVAIAPLTVTAPREAAVDFTQPFMLAELAFVHKKPSKSGLAPDIVINMVSVFHFGVWALLVISIILVTVGLWAIAFFINDEEFSRVGTSIDYIMSTLLFLTPKVRPTSLLLRAYSYLWLILRLIIFLIFLVHFFQFSSTQRLFPQRLSSFEDLANAISTGESYNVLFVPGGSTEGKFARSNYDVYSRIYNAYSQSDIQAKTTYEGIEMVRSDRQNIFIGEAPMLKYAASQTPCNLYMSEYQKVSMQPVSSYGLAVQKNSPLFGKISGELQSLTDSGYFMELEKKWFTSNKCDALDAKYFQDEGPMTVVVARSLFLLVLVLILYAIGVFIYTRLSGRPVENAQSVEASDKDSARNKGPEVKLEDVRCDGKEEAA